MIKDNYEDIIELPNHKSKKYPPMSRENRAAQFAPFAALNGYEDAVKEEARLTEKGIELSEEETELLNRKLMYLFKRSDDEPEAVITYFEPDSKKGGGRYVKLRGAVSRIDGIEGKVTLSGKKIEMRYITAIDILKEDPTEECENEDI